MEKITYETEHRNIEGFLLSIYSMYNLVMVVMSVEQNWNQWVSILLVVMAAVCWMIYAGKVKNYAFRATFTAIVMQISLILYAVCLEDFLSMLPVFMAFVVFLGLYGIADIIYMTVVSMIIICFYLGIIQNQIALHSMTEIRNMALQLGNVFLLEFVVYTWAKRNSEGSKKLLGVIEELKAVESSKDDFLANVSHEIRTPINTICGISELVLQEELPHEVKENVFNIQLAGKSLMGVVSDVLDFSELQSGKMELEEEAYNITSTINDVINMTMVRKAEKKIELIVDCDANIPCALLGDEKKIRRVIMKLVDNAIKFTNEGCVSISVGYRKESYGINLIVAVKDTGIGIEEESLEKLFTSFSQIDARRNRNEGGIGLGLAICHTLVQKMGGAITVRSKLGKGSMVQFVVPQKVLDETPIASIRDKANINVATYIDMEQFDMVAIRDEYSNSIMHMVEQLKGKCHICRNFAELQRRQKKECFSHIFISIVEYQQEQEYFDELAKKTKVIVVLERSDEKYVTGAQILKIYKPFYILTVVSVLNGLSDVQGIEYTHSARKFVTKGAHILVVDDNRINIRVIEGFLEEYKIRVSIATSGQEALEKITSQNYDFVFMDHMMPEMDGVETLHRIRQKVGNYYQRVPIVALTANAVAGSREMLLAEGFNDFLEKPVERSVLERVLKRNLPSEKIIYKDADSNSNNEIVEVVESTEENNVNEVMPEFTEIAKLLEEKGLDVQKGILYCNGEEQYLGILRGYCEECDESGNLAEELFKKQDWKNYTITVHGMKSSMRSIGAICISDLAKELEFAGKENRINYILEHHAGLMEEYNKLFTELRKYKWMSEQEEVKEEQIEQAQQEKEETQEVNEELLVLEDAEFDKILADMEKAMYTLDESWLMGIIDGLEKYQYHGNSLRTSLVPVRRKIEMSDYVSAVEMTARLKDTMARSEC